MAELGKAYVQIIPSAKGISGAISSELGGVGAAGTAAGQSLGSNLVGSLGKVLAAAGIGATVKKALDEAGALQQSFGGLDTIYGDAAEAAKGFAAEAAQMGISANEYAEQAVSFGAALKQAYGGDTVAAANAANEAIKAMADNSAKFGTDIGSVQNAFQGFAKQNYTMLDNLKLGYGGTKSEMERLLKDATALSGIDYDIENLGDVYNAIGVIQEELGVAGVAADEAKSTLTGSFGAMAAAAKNLMGNIALGEDIRGNLRELNESFMTWAGNLIPLVGNILQGLPEALNGAIGMAIQGLRITANNAPGIVQSGIEIVTGLVDSIVTALPYLAEVAIELVAALGNALFTTDWTAVGTGLINSLKDSMGLAAGEIFGADTNILDAISSSLTAQLPALLSKGVEIIMSLVSGILSALPTVIEVSGQVVAKFLEFLIQNAPAILSAGTLLLVNLVHGIIEAIPQVVSAILMVMSRLIGTIAANAPQLLQQGIALLGKLLSGILSAIPKIPGVIRQIIEKIVQLFTDHDWLQIGKDLLMGIVKGIQEAAGEAWKAIKETAVGLKDSLKEALKIGSPSKVMEELARWIPAGIAEGITNNAGVVYDTMNQIRAGAVSGFGAITATATGAAALPAARSDGGLLDALREMAEQQTEVKVVLQGDAAGVFKLVKQENYKITRATGSNLLAAGATG